MRPSLLLTSFDTWLPHQKSNTSDDLLAQVVQFDSFPKSRSLLRKLPVDSQLATNLTINRLETLQPHAIICCGMAESRRRMMLESQARRGGTILKTTLDVESLAAKLRTTEISDHAGHFVCNDFYYGILDHIYRQQLDTHCLFVHIPLISEDNLLQLQGDFLVLCQEIDRRSNCQHSAISSQSS
jgi:pyroglutamyl-peptidase